MTANLTTSLPEQDGTLTTLIDTLIGAQLAFIQQWLKNAEHQQQFVTALCDWLDEQPVATFCSVKLIQQVVHESLLAHPLTPETLADIHDVAVAIITHPSNETVLLGDLFTDAQINELAEYIGSHQTERHALIHVMLGNQSFADLLTKILYHAINDFTDSSLDKAGGVGKLMKMGRSQFEKATNQNLDGKLQYYLQRNIPHLVQRTEQSAQNHLTNAEVTRLIQQAWQGSKGYPISKIQAYLTADNSPKEIHAKNQNTHANMQIDTDNQSYHSIDNGNNNIYTNSRVDYAIQQLNTSHNHLRQLEYIHKLVDTGIQVWFDKHSSQTLSNLAQQWHIKEHIKADILTHSQHLLASLIDDIVESDWFTTLTNELLTAFYSQTTIKQLLSDSVHNG